jgi:glycosyltransferase involved in cell wall biosynthesis
LKIVLFNTDDSRGGAARAALRLLDALRLQGADARMVVQNKLTERPDVSACAPGVEAPTYSLLQQHYVNRARTSLTNTIFSLGYPGVPCVEDATVRQADIFNLHWVTNFFGPRQIHELLRLGKPVVWTFHDQWPMTGGCHYPAGCERFISECNACPQLAQDPARLVDALFQEKLAAYGGLITVVTPSRWMAETARKSRIFRDSRIEVIPYSLNLETFSPRDKSAAKTSLGIPADALVLLFACSAASELRKGGAKFVELRSLLLQDKSIRKLNEAGKLWFLFFGWGTEELSLPGTREKHLGFLKTDDSLRTAYNAADLLVHLSAEDNLPNTLLESVACGTAAIAVDAGGAAEIVRHNQNGIVVPYGDLRAMSAEIVRLLNNATELVSLGQTARRLAVEEYHPKTNAERHLKLFGELISENRSRSLPAALQFSVVEQATPGAVNSVAGAMNATVTEMQAKISELQKQVNLLTADLDRTYKRRFKKARRQAVSRLKSVFKSH